MKKYQKVVDRVEEYRYKKGIVRVDTASSLYKTGKILYIISFAWLMAFELWFIFGVAIQKLDGRDVLLEVLIVPPVFAFFLIIAMVLLYSKVHSIALGLNLIVPILNMAYFYRDDKVRLSIVENGISSKFIWCHFAPSILIIIFALIVCLIGIKTRCDFNKDYKKVMNSMYIKFKEENPIASDAEWQSYLEGEENGDT